MTILCIDTATEHGVVAVVREDGKMGSSTWRAAGRHGENLFDHIERALSEVGAQRDHLTLIGVDIGPGKFTSLRVGLGTAKGLALGLGLPIVGVGSLRVLARSIESEDGRVLVPLLDAYRGEVFGAAYVFEEGALREVLAPSFGPPEVVLGAIKQAAGARRIVVGGLGARTHAGALESALGVTAREVLGCVEASTPRALAAEVQDAFRADGPSDLDSLEPQYLRPSDAKLPDRALRTERTR
jgi:tRNA threonylcarbamoyladenosine biosynthesis protein TsaB